MKKGAFLESADRVGACLDDRAACVGRLAFTDIDSCPYKASIENLASIGIVGGYDDGTFRPDNLLMRQQFAKMAVLAMGL